MLRKTGVLVAFLFGMFFVGAAARPALAVSPVYIVSRTYIYNGSTETIVTVFSNGDVTTITFEPM